MAENPKYGNKENRYTKGSPDSNSSYKNNSDEYELYITESHDTLGSIAKKFGLSSWKYLYEYNKNLI
ncbi:MAG: LysM peptidoglycan-binding domain-containing protein [Chitinispirillaceae bacterium]|nr:LysM peptidoglycan-binding domain-containing protein [Chitinispirillaceae bacterium]